MNILFSNIKSLLKINTLFQKGIERKELHKTQYRKKIT